MPSPTLPGRVVEELIERFVSGDIEDPHELRPWAERHRALPVIFDMGGCYAVQATGEVVSFGWDTPEAIAIEENERIRNGVLFRAAQRFSELHPLVPRCPPNAVTCDSCDGTGRPKGIPPEIENIVCYCGGLGWIPAADEGRK